jgi:uncharacterized membrane protein
VSAGTFVATFFASVVEAIEMVAIVVGVGVVRGWRSSLIGAAVGFVVLIVLGGALGTALTSIPIDTLRLIIGALLLVFGLQWLKKGVIRVASKGFAGDEEEVDADVDRGKHLGLDWTAFVLSFKGVLLEGLEIAFIVVTFGAASNEIWLGALGGGLAIVVVGAVGFVFRDSLVRIPRSVLILVVGLMLTTFGTFWAAEGVHVSWPGGEWALLALLALYLATAVLFVALQRRQLAGKPQEAAA